MTMKELEKKIELLEKRIESLETANGRMLNIATELNDKIDETDHDLTNFIDCVYDINETTKNTFDTIESTLENISRNISKCWNRLGENKEHREVIERLDRVERLTGDYKNIRRYVHAIIEILNSIGVHIIFNK